MSRIKSAFAAMMAQLNSRSTDKCNDCACEIFTTLMANVLTNLRNIASRCETSRNRPPVVVGRLQVLTLGMSIAATIFKREVNPMFEWLWPVIIIVAYFVLMRWVLPGFGVQT